MRNFRIFFAKKSKKIEKNDLLLLLNEPSPHNHRLRCGDEHRDDKKKETYEKYDDDLWEGWTHCRNDVHDIEIQLRQKIRQSLHSGGRRRSTKHR
jgi:hypothetical protein